MLWQGETDYVDFKIKFPVELLGKKCPTKLGAFHFSQLFTQTHFYLFSHSNIHLDHILALVTVDQFKKSLEEIIIKPHFAL